jgi:hypothetical protein
MKLEELIDTVHEKAGHLHNVANRAMDLHLAISVFLKDYKDGDFELPELAQIHVREIKRKYTDMGKALYPIQNDL